jgi:hypothetical protein
LSAIRTTPHSIITSQSISKRGQYHYFILLDYFENSVKFIFIVAATICFFLNTKWAQNGITVAGGNGHGDNLNRLTEFCGIFVDDDQNILIADYNNHRIVEWRKGVTVGQVVAGGNANGSRNNQLNLPTDVVVDKQSNSLIICDGATNRRVMRWPRRGGRAGQTIISNIACCRLAMDDDGFLYVSDWEKREVRRWRIGETRGTVVAGGNGKGDRLDQFDSPHSIFVDRDRSVYVSDTGNHRVMKWVRGAREGIIVAGSRDHWGFTNALTQLLYPEAVFVDHFGTVYVADQGNHRIMRWLKGATYGTVVVGENGAGSRTNQLFYPMGLSFDWQGNLYVGDRENFRVQKFQIESSWN